MEGNNWISVKDRPLYTKDRLGWVCTEDGDKDFIAAVPTNKGWWVRHCIVEDEIGLCVVGDIDNEPAGWELEHVTHWQPLPKDPILVKSKGIEFVCDGSQLRCPK